MGKFKTMKFWIDNGDKGLYDAVCRELTRLGYKADDNIRCNVCAIQTDEDGFFAAATMEKGDWWYNGLKDHEEINIDWMRSDKLEFVELNGKKYLKSEIEAALSHIKPVEE